MWSSGRKELLRRRSIITQAGTPGDRTWPRTGNGGLPAAAICHLFPTFLLSRSLAGDAAPILGEPPLDRQRPHASQLAVSVVLDEVVEPRELRVAAGDDADVRMVAVRARHAPHTISTKRSTPLREYAACSARAAVLGTARTLKSRMSISFSR
jgi:hypothetical protein